MPAVLETIISPLDATSILRSPVEAKRKRSKRKKKVKKGGKKK